MKTILVIGSLNIDFVVSVDEMPLKGQTITGKKLELIGGGKGANQACATGKLGANTIMLGAVGDDSYGDMLLKNLDAANVDTSYIKKIEGINTGIALITVDNSGENSITVIAGANNEVDIAYINENRNIIERADIVIFQLEIPIETVVYAAKLAKQLGKIVILDPAPAPRDFPADLMQYVDLTKPNETELESLTGIAVTEDNLKFAANKLRDTGVSCVVVTRGAKGAYISAEGIEKVVPPIEVKVVDTTAAGDSFTAAMATILAQDGSIEEAVNYATKVASIVVSRKGAQSSLPTKAEVELL